MITYSTISFAALISVDRLWCIVFPIHYKLNTGSFNLAMKLLSIPWILAILTYSLPILLWQPISGEPIDSRWQCGVPFINEVELITFQGIMAFYVPFTIILICNTTIIILLYKRMRKMKSDQSVDEGKLAQYKSSLNAAKSLAILIVTFLVTWLPYEISNIWDPLCGFCMSYYWLWWTYYILWLNSALNPLCYPMMQQRIRVTIREVFSLSKGRIVGIELQIKSDR